MMVMILQWPFDMTVNNITAILMTRTTISEWTYEQKFWLSMSKRSMM